MIIVVWAPLLMRLLFGFPDEKQLMGAYLKSRRDEKTTDVGVLRLRLTEGKNPRNKRINKTKP